MTAPIAIEPGDGSGGGQYPPVNPTPSPSSSTPTPSPSPPAASDRTSSLAPSSERAVPVQLVPVSPVPAQEFVVSLGGQSCRMVTYVRGDDLYLDLFVSDVPIVQGVICQDRNLLVRAPYTGFVGELLFFDTQGVSDPSWPGLGSRYFLAWLGA